MFTGIIKGTAPVSKITHANALMRYSIELPAEFLAGLDLGASISIDGVCQTVVAIEDTHVWFDAIEETLSRTTLNHIQEGTLINFERAAKIGDEIGGHLLSGHIYGMACLVNIDKNIFTFKCPVEWMKFMFSKGFIAIDGMSLTLVEVERSLGQFTLHLIPETLKRTTLGNKKPGAFVNIELDALTQATVETIENILSKMRHYHLF